MSHHKNTVIRYHQGTGPTERQRAMRSRMTRKGTQLRVTIPSRNKILNEGWGTTRLPENTRFNSPAARITLTASSRFVAGGCT